MQRVSWLNRLGRNETVRNGALFSFFSFLNSGISFLLLIVIANYVDPTGYGHLNLFSLSVQLFNYFICLNTTGIISVNFFRMKRTGLLRSINAVLLLTLTGAIILGVLTYLFSAYLEQWTGLALHWQLAALAVCFFNVITQINLDLWRIEEKVATYGLYSTGLVLSNAVLSLVFIVAFHQDWQGRIYAWLLVGGSFCLFSFLLLIRRRYIVRLLPTLATFKDCLKFGIPLIPHNASFWIRQSLDRYFLNYFQSTSVVGLFSFSLNFSNIIQLIGGAFNATNSVFIYKNLAQKDTETVRQRLRKQTILMIAFFAVVTVLICAGAVCFIPVFFPKYADSTMFLICQCVGSFFQCVYLQFVNFLFYYKKTRVLMYITFSTSVLHALCSFWLTPYSALYTAYIGMFSNIVIAIGVFLYSRRIFRVI